MRKINYAESFKDGEFWEPFCDLVEAAAGHVEAEKVRDECEEKFTASLKLPEGEEKNHAVYEYVEQVQDVAFASQKVGFNAGYEAGFAAGARATKGE